jgi:uncharacterized protein (DUF1800 family)
MALSSPGIAAQLKPRGPTVRGEVQLEHLLRRAGFGASAEDVESFIDMRLTDVVQHLVNFGNLPDNVDRNIGTAGFVGITTRGPFQPNTIITDARQRWLFRMIHSPRPLQEKMALFWHNHFATAYSKIAGTAGFNATEATRLMAAKPDEDPAKVTGQLELFRELALGNFRDLLVAVAKDPAMLVWLDGRLNVRTRPQENYARELMELFTFGVGHFSEEDVYAAARVFTGWNLRRVNTGDTTTSYYEFVYNGGQHDATSKTFTFAIYADGNRTIPGRSADDGLQDGIDFITALARHPETARRLARKLYTFFVSELTAPEPAFINRVAAAYLTSGLSIKATVEYILTSETFYDPANHYARYAWPVEFVVRSLKEVGYAGFSVNDALAPLTNMGQTLFEPPDVNGWELGPAWFSTGSMLARLNFGSTLTRNQKFNLVGISTAHAKSPEQLLAYLMNDRLTPQAFSRPVYDELLAYLKSGSAWTASDAQLSSKAAGVVHLMLGTPQYQFV